MIPGFVAENSISEHLIYSVEAGTNMVLPERGVVMQLNTKARSKGGCIPGCICVTEKGCPCCDINEIIGVGPRKPIFSLRL